jgi:hypothetical protein
MEQNKKIIIIAGVGGAVILLLLLVVAFLKRGPAQPPQVSPTPRSTGFVIPTSKPTINPSLSPSPSPTPTPTLPVNYPTGPKITITDVTMNNFYTFGVQIKENGDVLILENDDYKIEYFKAKNEFLISILGRDFEGLQKQAEGVFLQKLGIREQDGCKLTALVGTAEAGESQYGMVYPLSFCVETP